jgi:phosphoheptose isomerase
MKRQEVMDAYQVAEQLQEIRNTAARLVESQVGAIQKTCDALIATLRRGHKLLVFGNGGSAAAAQHLASEFVGRFRRERVPLPALALTTDTAVLTGIANDYGFHMVFARQVRALGCAGDVAIGISTKGHSPNVLNGIDEATQMGLTTVALTGGDGGLLAKRTVIPIIVPTSSTPRIQECHTAITHVLCETVESALAQNGGITFGKDHCNGKRVTQNKLMQWPELLSLRKRWKDAGSRIVWTNGCFDLLHLGHLWSLTAARQFGDVLVVGVTGDDSVRQLKGPGRPIVPSHERAQLIASLDCVDAVVVVDESTPETALDRLKPDVHCKGAEYGKPNGKEIPEERLVASYGGRVELLAMQPNLSTTSLIGRIQKLASTGTRP